MHNHPPHDFLQQIGRAHLQSAHLSGLRENAELFARSALALLFPHFSRAQDAPFDANLAWESLDIQLRGLLKGRASAGTSERILATFPRIHSTLLSDALAIYEGDPAAESTDEVILTYPGFLAIAIYRLAHEIRREGVPLIPRLFTEMTHRATGIDIHPGASIGPAFAIDHGTGIVIGETSEIGERVKLYQGVTLGALSVKKSLGNMKRHPTIEDDVVIYAGATILGGKTTIGRGSVIGGNVWLTHGVPPGSVVTLEQISERTRTKRDFPLEFHL